MATDARILRALLRIESDKQSLRNTLDDIEQVDDALDQLGDQDLAGAGGGRLRGVLDQFKDLGGGPTEALDRIEFLGDGFEQLLDTADMLGIELGDTADQALQAATSLNRIATDPLGAVVNAVGQAVAAFQGFLGTIDEGQQGVSNAWGDLLGGDFASAADVATSYDEAQQRVNQAHERGGILADLFVDKTKVLNASQEDLTRALVMSADGFGDYLEAVRNINANLDEGEQALTLMTRGQFENTRALEEAREAYAAGRIGVLELADAYRELGQEVPDALTQIIEEAERLAEIDLQERMGEAATAFADFNDQIADAEAQYEDERVGAFADYKTQIEELETQHFDAGVAAEEAYAEEMRQGQTFLYLDLLSIADDFGRRREELAQDFAEKTADAEEDYYRRRQELAQDFGVEAARAEEDHQRQMQRMREDAQMREQDLVNSRDALGLARAQRDAEMERRRADSDFNLEQARRSEDYGRQLVELQANFERQQAERRANYEQQLAELDANQAEQEAKRQAKFERDKAALDEALVAEMERIDQAYNERVAETSRMLGDELETLKAGHRDEIDAIAAAWTERRKDLGVYLDGEQATLEASYAQKAQALDAWIEQTNASFSRLGGGGVTGGRAGGGYVGRGLYSVGEAGPEFVMSNATTTAAERAIGGNLSQSALLNALGASGRGGAGSIEANFNISGSGAPQEVAQEVLRVMEQLLDRVGV